MNKLYDETSIQNIANAIREKTETEDKMKVSEMADKILSITSGSKPADKVKINTVVTVERSST